MPDAHAPDPTRAVSEFSIRPDLLTAQADAWRHVTSPGASWTGDERRAMAQIALAALDDTEPLPPWESPTQTGRAMPGAKHLPDTVVEAVYLIARHAATLTDDWYRTQLAHGINPFAYVEMVGVVVAVAAVDGFFHAVGLERPPLSPPVTGTPHGRHPEVEAATLNWVPVAVPADRQAAVVQGLSAAPAEWDNVKRLATAQYVPVDEMGEPRGAGEHSSRADMEFVAARLWAARECFY